MAARRGGRARGRRLRRPGQARRQRQSRDGTDRRARLLLVGLERPHHQGTSLRLWFRARRTGGDVREHRCPDVQGAARGLDDWRLGRQAELLCRLAAVADGRPDSRGRHRHGGPRGRAVPRRDDSSRHPVSRLRQRREPGRGLLSRDALSELADGRRSATRCARPSGSSRSRRPISTRASTRRRELPVFFSQRRLQRRCAAGSSARRSRSRCGRRRDWRVRMSPARCRRSKKPLRGCQRSPDPMPSSRPSTRRKANTTRRSTAIARC